MSQVKEKEISCMEDIEIGDIFYDSWGYDQTNIDFYKVIKKTKAMVWLRAIGQTYLEQTGFMSEYVTADPEKEIFKTDWIKPEDIEAGWEKVEVEWHECRNAQENGLIKVQTPAITAHRPQFASYGTYIRIEGYRHARYWDGQKKYQSHYA
jgi:hypothetical protein